MDDTQYMKRALELAKKGQGWCHPNPMVGAVIVKDGRIIGEGYHEKWGEQHAERNAIRSLKEPAAGATIYVTLEPCCHQGRTPPCTQAIIEQQIAKVVIGSRDPNPKVSGKGVKQLRKAGIEVIEDVMRDECDVLNSVFLHYITTRTPYVLLKYAMTADGKIATKTGASQWITGPAARQKVQEMRHACMGIMVGIETVLADDPLLTCRLEKGRNPIRIICDSRLRIPMDSQIVRTAGEVSTIVAYTQVSDKLEPLKQAGIQTIQCGDTQVDIHRLMKQLGTMHIDSILLEGGGTLNESCLRAGIVSEIKAFTAPKIFGGQAKSPVEGTGVEFPNQAIVLRVDSIETVGQDILITYKI